MKKIISPVLWALIFTSLLVVVALVLLVKEFGTDFVHKPPGNESYFRQVPDRVVFPARGRGELLDSAFGQFMIRHPEYLVPENVQQQISNAHCNCLAFQRYLFFAKEPKEIYLITYDYNMGVIDMVFHPKGEEWSAFQSASLDSLDKARIRNRLITELLDSLPANTHF